MLLLMTYQAAGSGDREAISATTVFFGVGLCLRRGCHTRRHGLVGLAKNFGDPLLITILPIWESSGTQSSWVWAVLCNTKITHLVRKCISRD